MFLLEWGKVIFNIAKVTPPVLQQQLLEGRGLVEKVLVGLLTWGLCPDCFHFYLNKKNCGWKVFFNIFLSAFSSWEEGGT